MWKFDVEDVTRKRRRTHALTIEHNHELILLWVAKSTWNVHIGSFVISPLLANFLKELVVAHMLAFDMSLQYN